MQYSHQKIEHKWQSYWLQHATFSTNLFDRRRPKFYILDMFPYPSGKGLHVGHLRGYVATDVIARMKRMQNYHVFHPIGFDSFGLPAEQYALKTGQDPQQFTDKNIANFIRQLQAIGLTYDYRKQLRTSDPRYFRWTQWIFQQFYQAKLAYQAKVAVNYCPELNTVLANEEIVASDATMVSERGQFPVFRRYTKQWLLDIVRYAPSLLSQIPHLDWPAAIKQAQIKWIGAQAGYQVAVPVYALPQTKLGTLTVFNQHLNDWYQTRFLIVAFDYQGLDRNLSSQVRQKLDVYRQKLRREPLVNPKVLRQTPIGLNSELFCQNPLTQQMVPIYFSDLVNLDTPNGNQITVLKFSWAFWFFAQHHQILSTQLLVAERPDAQRTFPVIDNHTIITRHNQVSFQPRTYYRLRNWVFSRQRYWGEPFPLQHTSNGKIQLLPLAKLPLQLPAFRTISSKITAISPLAKLKAWVDQGYDPNVMPQWAGSSWYYLAYLLVKEDGDFWPLNSAKARQILDYWMPVDFYVGGQEHAVSHLLYARFWNQFLVQKVRLHSHLEPFKRLVNQGLILGPDHKKMSKSRGNVVDPMQYLASHGADALRLYIQFLGPFHAKIAWSERNLDAMRKWLARVYVLFVKTNCWSATRTQHHTYLIHDTIKTVTEAYRNQRFNVAIAKLMSFINVCYKQQPVYHRYGRYFLQLLNPICPHLTEEIWNLWGNATRLADSQWPTYDPQQLVRTQTIYALQINGKTKRTFKLARDLSQNQVIAYCQQHYRHLLPPKYNRLIFVLNKIINFVL